MLKKIFTAVITAALVAAMASPAAAFEPDKDAAMTRYYSFEDTVGDLKPLAKPLPATEGFADGGNILFAEGVHGKALQLDGETGFEIGKDIVKGENFTIAMWMNPEDITPWTAAFFARRFAEDDFDRFWMSIAPRTDIDANPDRKMMFWTCGQDDMNYWFDGISTVAPELNKWIHVAVTFNKEDIVMYGDGEIIFDTRTADFNFTSDIYVVSEAWKLGGATFYIGANEFADAAFKGKIDEFYSFNRTLSQDEIKTLMNYNSSAAAAPAPEAAAPAAPEAAAQPEAAPAPAAPAPAQTAPAPAPKTADPITLIALGSLISAAGVVIARKRK